MKVTATKITIFILKNYPLIICDMIVLNLVTVPPDASSSFPSLKNTTTKTFLQIYFSPGSLRVSTVSTCTMMCLFLLIYANIMLLILTFNRQYSKNTETPTTGVALLGWPGHSSLKDSGVALSLRANTKHME